MVKKTPVLILQCNKGTMKVYYGRCTLMRCHRAWRRESQRYDSFGPSRSTEKIVSRKGLPLDFPGIRWEIWEIEISILPENGQATGSGVDVAQYARIGLQRTAAMGPVE